MPQEGRQRGRRLKTPQRGRNKRYREPIELSIHQCKDKSHRVDWGIDQRSNAGRKQHTSATHTDRKKRPRNSGSIETGRYHFRKSFLFGGTCLQCSVLKPFPFTLAIFLYCVLDYGCAPLSPLLGLIFFFRQCFYRKPSID